MSSNYKNLARGLTSTEVTAIIDATYPTALNKGGTGAAAASKLAASDAIEAVNYGAAQTLTTSQRRIRRVNTEVSRRSAASVVPSAYLYTLISGTVNTTGGGTPSQFLLGCNSGVTGKGRAVHVTNGNGHHYPGTFATIDWTKGWICRFRAAVIVATHASSVISLKFGCTSTPTDHPLTVLGLRITWAGTGAGACNVKLSSWRTSEVTGTGGTWAANDTNEYDFEMEYVPGEGVYLWKDNDTSALCSFTTIASLPTGTGTAGNTNTGWVLEGNSAAANQSLVVFSDLMFTRT